MNSKVFNIILTILFLSFGFSAKAVVAVESLPIKQMDLTEERSKGANDQLIANSNKENRILKRSKRLVKRFFKKNNSFGNVFSSRKFRLGALLLVLGLIGAILINIFSLAQIFGWLSGVLAVTGLVLMIWALIQHSSLV